ncbi:MAG: reactive intermediate/imine deaminase [Barnesiella sp.]|nr:reactive intermediate/imine deaminase [Barnesiella sp.]
MKKQIATTAAPAAIGPYSQAIDLGNMVFISGQIPVNPANGEIPEGIKAQTAQSISNIKAILAEAGLTIDNVVKTTVFLADMSLFTDMNEVYGEAFTAPYPARSAVAVRELPKQVLVEIETIAVR